MKERKTGQDSWKRYVKALAVFLVFMAVSLFCFFYFVAQDVERNVRSTIMDDARRQSYHFSSIIDVQYGYLEGLTSYLAEQETLVSEENLALLRSVNQNTELDRLAIIEADGMAYYDSGEKKNVSGRDYFIEAMRGSRWFSDPLESVVDGQTRVILSVPIERDGESIGVLGASYNVGELSHILFEDLYGGAGYSMIVTGTGEIVDHDGDPNFQNLREEENFFEHLSQNHFFESASVEDVRNDFSGQKTGIRKFRYEKEARYLSYAPLNQNDWMLCYIVPQDTAKQAYSFIQDYEIILIAAFAAAVALLLLEIYRTNVRRQKALIRYAQVDALTGIFNKKSTEDRIRYWMENEGSSGTQAFLMIDIDKFKEINDIYGHPAGDEVLQEVGQMLRQQFREDDIIGRIGGDEFVILMKNLNSKTNAERKAQEICAEFRKIKLSKWTDVRLTCSVGLAFAPEHGSGYLELYQCADRALYEAKQRGRDRYVCYQEAQERSNYEK